MTPRISLDPIGITRVEHNIMPPMGTAISLPVALDGEDTGLCVYVSESSFRALLNLPEKVTVSQVAQFLVEAVEAYKRAQRKKVPS